MKFSIFALAATLAVVSAADCDLTTIAPLLTNTNVATCTTDSGFSFTAPTTPTGEMLTKVCASTACQTVLTAVKALGLGDCTVLGIQLETDLLTPIAKGCASSTTSSGSTAGSSAGSTSTTVTVTTTTVPTTTTPASTTAASTAGSSASSSAVTTPAPTTSAATKVTVATSAAVVAIAAAFM